MFSYVFFGSDEGAAASSAQKCFDELAEGTDGWGNEVIDGTAATVDEALDLVQLAGYYADVSMLVVREDGMSVRDINDCLDSLYRMCPDVVGYCLNNCVKLEDYLWKFK